MDSDIVSSSVVTSKAIGSKIGNCKVRLAYLLDSKAEKSSILYSILKRSSVSEADLNAEYTDHRLDGSHPSVIFPKEGLYNFNRIFDSIISKSAVGKYKGCNGSPLNSTIVATKVASSAVQGLFAVSSIVDRSSVCSSFVHSSRVTDDTEVRESDIRGSTVETTVVAYSSSMKSKLKESDISYSKVSNSAVFNSKVISSQIEDSSCTKSDFDNVLITQSKLQESKVIISEVTKGSTVKSSSLTSSNVSDQSIVINSNIQDSKISSSQLEDCIVHKSTIYGQKLRSVSVYYNVVIRR